MKIRKNIHPFEFILNKFIKPLSLTQAILQKELNVGPKTLSELYNRKRGISPLMAAKLGKYFSIAPELLLKMQIEYELANTYQKFHKDIELIKPLSLHQSPLLQDDLKKNVKNSKPMLLSTLNNSVSAKENHYTVKDLDSLFHTKRFTQKKHYAIRTIFSEGSVQELIHFTKQRNIPMDTVKSLYRYYTSELKGRPNAKFEWLFK